MDSHTLSFTTDRTVYAATAAARREWCRRSPCRGCRSPLPLLRTTAAVLASLALPATLFAGITVTGDTTAVVNSAAVTLPQMVVGKNGVGTLTVNGGSDLILNGPPSDPYLGSLIVGELAGSTGTITLNGSGSSINSQRAAYFGKYGSGSIAITGGARLDVTTGYGDVFVNRWATNATSTVNIGAGSTLAAAGVFSVAASTGIRDEVTITNGTLTSQSIGMGYGGAYNQSTDMVFNGGTINTGSFDIAYNTDASLTMSAGTLTASFFTVGFQDIGKLNMTGGTMTTGSFRVGAASQGRGEVTIGPGATVNTQSADFGPAGIGLATIQGAFSSNASITIGGGTNKSGVVTVYSGATFKTNAFLDVGGTSTSQFGNLGLFGNATAQATAGIRIKRGGLVESIEVPGTVSTLKVTGGYVDVDGILKARQTSVLALDTSQRSRINTNGAIEIEMNVLAGLASTGKIRLLEDIQLGGSLILSHAGTSTSTSVPMYTPITIIEGATSLDNVVGTFAAIKTKSSLGNLYDNSINASTAFAVTYGSNFVRVTRAKKGDTNLDNAVNFTDLLALAQKYGTNGTWANGDFNGNGNIGFDDLLVLAQFYQSSSFSDSGDELTGTFAGDWLLAQSMVPEPTTLVASVLALPVLSRKRREAR